MLEVRRRQFGNPFIVAGYPKPVFNVSLFIFLVNK
jgi:hypothetical protein